MKKKLTKEKIAELAFKQAETQEKIQAVDSEQAKLGHEDDRILLEKIKTLQGLVESITVDSDKQIVGCDLTFKPTFDESETYTLKDKLFNLIEKL